MHQVRFEPYMADTEQQTTNREMQAMLRPLMMRSYGLNTPESNEVSPRLEVQVAIALCHVSTISARFECNTMQAEREQINQ